MRIAYFDCFAGICGNMILGALIDLGLNAEDLKGELKKLKLSGYDIGITKAERGGIWGTNLNVAVSKDQAERNLNDVFNIIENSKLDDGVKNESKEIFLKLAKAEAKIHNKDIGKIHFHEVGATDAIIDIVGSTIALKKLGIERVYASKLHLGTGFVKCSHGVLPVPAPATLELLKGVPVYSTGVEGELVTPTGAAVITTISKSFGPIPSMRIEKIGYGAGDRDSSIPNMLRVFVGNSEVKHKQDRVLVLETNIDDMNPQLYEYVSDLLLERGAKDVFLTPIYMKKNRPGIVLSVISSPDKVEELIEIVLRETTTLGVRISEMRRREKLGREIKAINTRFGRVRVKLGFIGDEVKEVAPEYEDCKRIARQRHLPIRDVFEEVKRSAYKLKGGV